MALVRLNIPIVKTTLMLQGSSLDDLPQELLKEFPDLPDWLTELKLPTEKEAKGLADALGEDNHNFIFHRMEIDIPDFRKQADNHNMSLAHLEDTIYYNECRQDWLKYDYEYFGKEDLDFVGSLNWRKIDTRQAANHVIDVLALNNGKRNEWSIRDVFNFLVRQAEQKGILVARNTHFRYPRLDYPPSTHPIDSNWMSGFALHDKQVPLIFITHNNNIYDQCFAFLYELIHIFLGMSALSNITNPKIGKLDELGTWCYYVVSWILDTFHLDANNDSTNDQGAQVVNYLTPSLQRMIITNTLEMKTLYRDAYSLLSADHSMFEAMAKDFKLMGG